MQSIANRLPDAFTDAKQVTKSHIPAENAPARLEIPEGTLNQQIASESQIRRKRGDHQVLRIRFPERGKNQYPT